MKFLMFATVAALAGSAPAMAESGTTPAALTTAPAPSTLAGNTPIEVLVASPVANPVLLKHFPNLDKHGAYAMFKGMSLREVAPLSDGNITEKKIVAFEVELKTAK